MALPNGRVTMASSITPSTISPMSLSTNGGIPQSMTPSTLDDASLEELDRIMDTLSTLSRDASMARGAKDGNKLSLPSPPSDFTSNGLKSYPNVSQSSTSFKMYNPTTTGHPIPASVSLPPPTTSPPKTPIQHQRNFISFPKIMTIGAFPSQQQTPRNQTTRSDARTPATIPRLPVNPYENTNILHGSQVTVRPPTITDNLNPFPLVPDSPYVNKHPSTSDSSAQCFFGQMPTPPPNEDIELQSHKPIGEDRNTQSNNHRSDCHQMRPESNRPVLSLHRPNRNIQEAHTLPAYNDKRSYLKNLEEGTLPRARIDSTRQTSRQATPNIHRKLKQKPSLSEEAGEALNRLSLGRSKASTSKRTPGRFGLRNLSKTPSRHSTTSFNSSDIGRGYASVSTVPASTHGLIQHEVLPHGRQKRATSPLNQKSSSEEEEDESCFIKCGRFLYSHILELFILVAFCAGLPAGIVIQATRFHTTEQFHKYYTFWGSTMLPMVLSTLTPLLVVTSMLSGIGNLTTKISQRVTVLAIIYYTLTAFLAIGTAILFSLVIGPGTHLRDFQKQNATNFTMNDQSALKSNRIILAVSKEGEDVEGYNPNTNANANAFDEIFYLIRMFFPGCGAPIIEDSNIGVCNLFALTLFAGVIGLGASMMHMQGGPIRHVFSQIGIVMSNMADVLLWYVPFGVFFVVSEIVATNINWTNIGHDGGADAVPSANGSFTTIDTTRLNDATHRFIVTVVASVGTFTLALTIMACIFTLSPPYSFISFRGVAPILTSFTAGFSDLCIPLTLRSLLKSQGVSRCSKSKEQTDRRIAKFSVITGGIFNRPGTVIMLTSSVIFLSQIEGRNITFGTISIIGLSSMITSVASPTGRWFYGFNPYMRGLVITLSSAGIASPAEIPESLLCLWAICRFAAFGDTIADIIGARLLHFYCKSKLKDIHDTKDHSKDESTTDSSNVDSAKRDTSSNNNTNPVRSTSGETSDYEDAPLLFSRSTEGGNESSSMNSRNDDSVFLPNRPHDTRSHQQAHDIGHSHTLHNRQPNNHGEVSFVTF